MSIVISFFSKTNCFLFVEGKGTWTLKFASRGFFSTYFSWKGNKQYETYNNSVSMQQISSVRYWHTQDQFARYFILRTCITKYNTLVYAEQIKQFTSITVFFFYYSPTLIISRCTVRRWKNFVLTTESGSIDGSVCKLRIQLSQTDMGNVTLQVIKDWACVDPLVKQTSAPHHKRPKFCSLFTALIIFSKSCNAYWRALLLHGLVVANLVLVTSPVRTTNLHNETFLEGRMS